MNNKRTHGALFALLALMVMPAGFASCEGKAQAQSGGGNEAETSGPVTVYNQFMDVLESKWEYSDGTMVALTFVEGPIPMAKTLCFTDDEETLKFYSAAPGLSAFRGAVDKAIEWAAVARENKVQDTLKQIGDIVAVPYLINGQAAWGVQYVMFSFQIVKQKGTDETFLLIKYDDRNVSGTRSAIAFKEKDFKRVKNILSDESLAEARNKEREKAKTEELFK